MGIIDNTKTCTKCRHTKSIEMFSMQRGYADGRRSQCKPCRRDIEAERRLRPGYRRTNTTVVDRARRIAKSYGVSLDEYKQLLLAQGECCALCERGAGWKYGVLVIDHCHATGRIRGLLCNSCNTALGKLGDTEEAITKALVYVKGEASHG